MLYTVYQNFGWNLFLGSTDKGLCRVEFLRNADDRVSDQSSFHRQDDAFVDVIQQFDEYFSNDRKTFDLPLYFSTGTDFQKRVWNALREIPFGQTRTYGDISRAVGSPKSFRAVGQANGKNPIPIIVPCHRVIAALGKLGGFSGGLDFKTRLLRLEGLDF